MRIGLILHILRLLTIPVNYCLCLCLHKYPLCTISNIYLFSSNNRTKSKLEINPRLSFINLKRFPLKVKSRPVLSSEYAPTLEVDTMATDIQENPEDSPKIPHPKPKTNLILTVSYDGSNYFGMVGPMVFLSEYGIPVKSNNTCIDSVTNQLMKTITLIQGYFGNKRKLKLKNTEEQSKKLKPCNGSSDTNGFHEDEETSSSELLEDYLSRFSMVTSSRTDRGVHSMGNACQYMSYDKELNFKSLEEFQDSLNRRLPKDIRVTSVIFSPSEEFNVRHNNLGKCYVYKVDLSSLPPLYERNYYWQIMSDRQFVNTLMRKYKNVKSRFSFEKLQEAGKVFEGTHNFEGFRKTSRGNERENVVDPICTIHSVEFSKNPQENKIEISIKGNRFLYKMVRCMVSHLILAGYNVIRPDQIKHMLDTGTEIPNIPYAPAHGLYLKNVFFEKEVQEKLNESNQKYQERQSRILN